MTRSHIDVSVESSSPPRVMSINGTTVAFDVCSRCRMPPARADAWSSAMPLSPDAYQSQCSAAASDPRPTDPRPTDLLNKARQGARQRIVQNTSSRLAAAPESRQVGANKAFFCHPRNSRNILPPTSSRDLAACNASHWVSYEEEAAQWAYRSPGTP